MKSRFDVNAALGRNERKTTSPRVHSDQTANPTNTLGRTSSGSAIETRNSKIENDSSTTPFSLKNQDGYWELNSPSGDSRCLLFQHKALFYVAWLLAHKGAKPLTPTQLASKVYVAYLNHPDFTRDMDWVIRHHFNADVTAVLAQKQKHNESIVDNPNEPFTVRNEAMQELTLIYELQETYTAETIKTDKRIEKDLRSSLLDFVNLLSTAADSKGQPCELMRKFNRHILWHIVMPYIRTGLLSYNP